MNRLILTACVAALITSAVVSSASAAERTVTETGAVKISDLNLATEQGAKTLLLRVKAKAGDLCAQTESPLFPGAWKAERECLAKAVAKSVGQLNAPMVTAEYVREFGHPVALVATR